MQTIKLLTEKMNLFPNSTKVKNSIKPIPKQEFFDDGLCLAVKFNQGEPIEDLEMVRKLGVKWVREEIAWSSIESKRGIYKPLPDHLKARLEFYKKNDIGVIFIMAYENGLAYPNSKAQPFNFVNPSAFGRYTAYMAKQLKLSGVRFVIELWNEPHNSTFAKKEYLGGNWQGAPSSPWVNHYVKMVNQAVLRVKAIDRNIHVITNDDMWIIHYHFMDRGLPKALDGFAVHPYVKGPPEIAAVAHDTDWTRPYQVVDEDQSFESAVRRLKAQGELKMGKTPAIWITEWGWPIGENLEAGQVDESTLAMYLPRAYILAATAKTKALCWFSSQDVDDGPYGLKTNEGRYRPAYDAFITMSQTLGKSTFVCELKEEETSRRSFAFKKEQNWIIASWLTEGNSFYDEAVTYNNISDATYKPDCK